MAERKRQGYSRFDTESQDNESRNAVCNLPQNTADEMAFQENYKIELESSHHKKPHTSANEVRKGLLDCKFMDVKFDISMTYLHSNAACFKIAS